jgi:hypothetical protein
MLAGPVNSNASRLIIETRITLFILFTLTLKRSSGSSSNALIGFHLIIIVLRNEQRECSINHPVAKSSAGGNRFEQGRGILAW